MRPAHNPIDMTRGGYRGDSIEEAFKTYTHKHLSYWWHFREVLRSSASRAVWWSQADGTPLTDDHQRELVGLSLLHYAVNMGIAEAVASRDELNLLARDFPADPFEFQRKWRAAYGGLYSSFTALFNVVGLLADPSRPLVKSDGVLNYYFADVKKILEGKGKEPQPQRVLSSLKAVNELLGIRSQLAHYWLIWVQHRSDGVYMDDSFIAKGHLPVDPPAAYTVDVVNRLSKDIDEVCAKYDSIYELLSVADGCLDKFLATRGFMVKYDDYGAPHNGARPRP